MTLVDPRLAPHVRPPWWAMTNNTAQGVGNIPFPQQALPQSLLQRLGSGLFPDLAGGMLGPEALGQARRMGLLNAGLAMLQNSGPSTERRELGQLLAGGIQQGQQAYQGAIGSALQQQEIMAQMAKRKRMEAIAEKYAPVEGETQAQRNNRLAGMVADFIREDPSMAGQLNAFAPLFKSPEVEKEVRGMLVETARGQQLVNPVTGEVIAQYGAKPEPAKTPAAERPLTEGERKAGVLLEIAEPSARALDDFDAPGRLQQEAGRKGINEFLSENQQLLNTHSLAVADAYIRLTSGANAPEPEVQRAFNMIAPRSGDSAKTLELKREMRQRMIRALRRAAREDTQRARSAASAAGEDFSGIESGASSSAPITRLQKKYGSVR